MLFFLGMVKLDVSLAQVLIDVQDGGLVPAPIAIVGSRKHSDYVIVVRFTEALGHQLMGSSDHLEAICMVELFCHVLPEKIADSPWTRLPGRDILLWV